jgi:hypothetical protein
VWDLRVTCCGTQPAEPAQRPSHGQDRYGAMAQSRGATARCYLGGTPHTKVCSLHALWDADTLCWKTLHRGNTAPAGVHGGDGRHAGHCKPHKSGCAANQKAGRAAWRQVTGGARRRCKEGIGFSHADFVGWLLRTCGGCGRVDLRLQGSQQLPSASEASGANLQQGRNTQPSSIYVSAPERHKHEGLSSLA